MWRSWIFFLLWIIPLASLVVIFLKDFHFFTFPILDECRGCDLCKMLYAVSLVFEGFFCGKFICTVVFNKRSNICKWLVHITAMAGCHIVEKFKRFTGVLALNYWGLCCKQIPTFVGFVNSHCIKSVNAFCMKSGITWLNQSEKSRNEWSGSFFYCLWTVRFNT